MSKLIRTLMIGVGAVLMLGTFTACSSGTSTDEATTTTGETTTETTTAAAMPETATFIADMPGEEGHAMTMAISVEGDQVAAYACNGTDDEAWFFGTQENGVMNLTSNFDDTMTATFEDGALTGTLTMGDHIQTFSARTAAEPAGIYTATMNGERASWIVMPDGRTTGVLNRSFNNDRRALREVLQQQQDRADKVRQMRMDRQLQQAPALNMDTMDADMEGTTVRATQVTGSVRFN